jgi:hypothetical protein
MHVGGDDHNVYLILGSKIGQAIRCSPGHDLWSHIYFSVVNPAYQFVEVFPGGGFTFRRDSFYICLGKPDFRISAGC